jgi:hypothetical protein
MSLQCFQLRATKKPILINPADIISVEEAADQEMDGPGSTIAVRYGANVKYHVVSDLLSNIFAENRVWPSQK